MKVLLVEDDMFFQKFYGFKLSEQSFDVLVAKDGEECMAKLKTHMPDLILLDLIMPKKDGFSVLESLSTDPALQKIPVIVFSTLNQEEDIIRAKQLGALDFVNKSLFDFDTLMQKIQLHVKSS